MCLECSQGIHLKCNDPSFGHGVNETYLFCWCAVPTVCVSIEGGVGPEDLPRVESAPEEEGDHSRVEATRGE